jgi:threonine/homoserine/homoserine lactone efflux protein
MIFGIVAADFLFIIAAVAGLSVVAAALGPFYVLIELLAGLLLIVFGFSQVRARPSPAETVARPVGEWAASFTGGFLLTLGDPKAIVGYMSLLPAFIDLSAVSVADVATVMLLATVAVFLAKVSYILLGERAMAMLKSEKAGTLLKRAAGAVLLAVGSVLAVRAGVALAADAG